MFRRLGEPFRTFALLLFLAAELVGPKRRQEDWQDDGAGCFPSGRRELAPIPSALKRRRRLRGKLVAACAEKLLAWASRFQRSNRGCRGTAMKAGNRKGGKSEKQQLAKQQQTLHRAFVRFPRQLEGSWKVASAATVGSARALPDAQCSTDGWIYRRRSVQPGERSNQVLSG